MNHWMFTHDDDDVFVVWFKKMKSFIEYSYDMDGFIDKEKSN